MQDKIILGFLAFHDRSLYDLKKAMERSTQLFYNASTGSLHPALKKLEQKGWVTAEESWVGKRAKKVYHRTEAGKSAFETWIAEPLQNATIKDEAILRLFFLGHQEQPIHGQVTAYLGQLTNQQQALQTIATEQERLEIPEPLKKVAFFQWQTLKFGIDYLGFCREWLEKMLAEYDQQFSSVSESKKEP